MTIHAYKIFKQKHQQKEYKGTLKKIHKCILFDQYSNILKALLVNIRPSKKRDLQTGNKINNYYYNKYFLL